MTRCRSFTNAFGNQSLFVPVDCPPDEIPEFYRKLITEPYRQFLESPIELLTQHFAGSKIESLRKWLPFILQNEIGLVIHYAMVYGHRQLHLAISGSLPRFGTIQWRLPVSDSKITGIPAIDEVYKAMDGTIEQTDAFQSGGWVRSNWRRMDWEASIPEFPTQYKDALLLYEIDGNQLFLHDEDVFSIMIDSRRVSLQGKASELVSDYFQCRLDGRRWHPFPY